MSNSVEVSDVANAIFQKRGSREMFSIFHEHAFALLNLKVVQPLTIRSIKALNNV